MAAAELASSLKPGVTDELVRLFEDEDSAVRYWAAMGILMRGTDAVGASKAVLKKALADDSPHVRVIAAQALGQYGSESDAAEAVSVLMKLAPVDANGVFVSMLALNALDALDGKAKSAADEIAALPQKDPSAPKRMGGYVPNLIKKTTADLQ